MIALFFFRTVTYSAEEMVFSNKKKIPQTIISQVLIYGVARQILFLSLPW